MSIVLYGCDICKTTFKMGKYTGGDCPECGQEYLYDEGISIRLDSEQRERLRWEWMEKKGVELIELVEPVKYTEAQKEMLRELGWYR